MHSIATSSGKSFEAMEGETLLDAALRQQVVLDYSCRIGRCSSCKGRVLNGETTAICDELGLSADERAQGFILTCARKACGPVVLEIGDLGDVTLPEAKTYPCRIQSLERLSCDVLRIMLRLPPTSILNFLPGQYIDVIGAEGVRRSYSIANAPKADKQIELHVREVPGGAMSHFWFQQAQVNDLLRLHGPLGTFFLREQAGRDLIFLATGTGISPVKAMLEGLSVLNETQQPRDITIYWGGRSRDDFYWQPPEQPRLRFVPVLSRPDEEWSGARGYVQAAAITNCVDLNDTLVYACGSEAMIRSAQKAFSDVGLPTRHFRSDAFVCSGTH